MPKVLSVMEVSPRLAKRYQSALDDVAGQREALANQCSLEDEYLVHVADIVRPQLSDAAVAAYGKPMAFSGGGDAMTAILMQAAAEVQAAASTAGRSVDIVCAAWPDSAWNAFVVRDGDGGVVFFTSGLFVALRSLCQYVALALEDITGGKEAGTDRRTRDEIATFVTSLVDRQHANLDIRAPTHLFVFSGVREVFRRQLNYLCLAYVIAHELGHLAEQLPPEAPVQALSLGLLRQPKSEQHELGSQAGELAADRVACDLLSHAPLAATPLLPISVYAPMLVLGLQTALWWCDRASGSPDYGWSHPAPDIRLYGVVLELTAEAPEPLRAAVDRFRIWLYAVFGIDELMKKARNVGDNESAG